MANEIEKKSKRIKVSSRGGARQGAGRPKGRKDAKTIEIQAAAKEYAGDALAALAEIVNNGASEAARISAATALLDRGYGKPRQAIEHSGNVGNGGAMIVPAPQDADTWSREVADRQAALLSLVPKREDAA